MQVKCIKKDIITAPQWFPEGTESEAGNTGSALLATWRSRGEYTGGGICLTATEFRVSRDEPQNTFWRCQGLFILGGRRSITHWLRLQGSEPLIYNNEGRMPLFVYVARKRKALGKDLTMVCVSAFEGLRPTGGGWTLAGTADIRLMPEAKKGMGGATLGEIDPQGLANVLERMFAGTN